MEIRNMEYSKERIKRQCREEPKRETEAEGGKKPWGWAFTKYCVYKEEAGSPNDLKRYERLLNFEKTAGEERQ
jgi:hypothetical protein